MRRKTVLLVAILMLTLCASCSADDSNDFENATSTVIVPDVIGMQLEQAKKSIKDSGLVIGDIYYEDDIEDNDEDTVVDQLPQAGEEVNTGEKVDMDVEK